MKEAFAKNAEPDKTLLSFSVSYHFPLENSLRERVTVLLIGTFQCRGVLLILAMVRQGSSMLAIDAGRGYLDFLFSLIYQSFLSSSFLVQTLISKRAVKP